MRDLQNTRWLDLISDSVDFYNQAGHAYQQHRQKNLKDYKLVRQSAKLDFDGYLSFKPDSRPFFNAERKGIKRHGTELQNIKHSQLGQYHFSPDSAQTKEIAELLDLDYLCVTLNRQVPGQQVGVHYDMNRNFDPDLITEVCVKHIKKYIVFLQKWQIGQVFCLGKSAITDWQPGDIIEFPWYMPHATANCSEVDRNILFISGVKFEQ